MEGLTILNRKLLAMERAPAMHIQVVHALYGLWDKRHGLCVLNQLLATAVLADKAHSGSEDNPASLSGLNGPGGERLARANSLDVIEDGNVCVSSQDEIAVH